MNTQTRAWLIDQLKGLLVIAVISLALGIGVNAFRSNPIPWVEKRRILKAGDRFPYVPLSTTEIQGFQKYLGLPQGKEVVTIVDIQADILLIEVLNVFCFPCQNQTLVLNRVYEMIESNPDLKGKVKIIGVALGNTKKVVDDFVKDYRLLFPVIPDPDVQSEKIIGPGLYTPFSLFLRRDASNKMGLVAGTHPGEIEDPKILLNVFEILLRGGPGSENPEKLFPNGNDKKKDPSQSSSKII